MLKPENRLQKNREFHNVFKNGISFFSPLLKIVVNDRGDENPSRIGFVVSNKISKVAARRNKIKRQLREATRGRAPTLKPGNDIVVVVHQRILESDFNEIKKSLDEVLKKAQLV